MDMKKNLGFLVMVGVIALAVLAKSVVVVPAGHVGVQILFGNVQEGHLQEGIHLINPLMTIEEMSVRTQKITEHAESPSKEGLVVALDLTLQFRLDPSKAAEVFRKVGPDYSEIIIKPGVRSVIRDVTAEYEAEALYTSARATLKEQMDRRLREALLKRGLIVEDVLMRQIKLPANLAKAIEEKLEEDQKAKKMSFTLAREQQEAERKRVEAKGIADSNRIVAESLNDTVLRFEGIKATLKLAESPNSKVVVVGGAKEGLPLILGNQ